MSEEGKVNILLVDDQPQKLLSYEVILRDLGENLIKAGSAREALEQLLKTDVAVILMDVCMPELDGFELASMLREHPRFEKTAIIFVSAIHLTEFDRIRGYETGAVDYIPVPVVPELLRAKVRIFVELYRKTRELIALNRELERRVGERTAELEASNDRLRESEERLRLAGEAAGFGTYDYNVDADRVHCSTGLKRLLGTQLEGDFSLDVLVSLVHDVDREAFRECLLAARAQNQERHEIEFRVVLPDGSVRWLLDRGRTYVSDHFAGTRSHVRVMGTMIDITGRKRSDERQALLMGELDHRVKNILANMSAIAKLSSAKATSVASFVRDLDGRIQAISGAHTLLRAHAWNGADLVDLVNETMAPFRSSGNISVEGGHIMLEPRVAQTFALMLHELATNAVKYGALSSPKGRINIKWSGSSDVRKLKFVWQETGGPTVHQPELHRFRQPGAEECGKRRGRNGCLLIQGGRIRIHAHGWPNANRNGCADRRGNDAGGISGTKRLADTGRRGRATRGAADPRRSRIRRPLRDRAGWNGRTGLGTGRWRNIRLRYPRRETRANNE